MVLLNLISFLFNLGNILHLKSLTIGTFSFFANFYQIQPIIHTWRDTNFKAEFLTLQTGAGARKHNYKIVSLYPCSSKTIEGKIAQIVHQICAKHNLTKDLFRKKQSGGLNTESK